MLEFIDTALLPQERFSKNYLKIIYLCYISSMKIFISILILFFLNSCTVNNNYRNPTNNELTKKKLKIAQLMGELKANAEKSGENFASALKQMKDTNYISDREFSTIHNNWMDAKKVSNKFFVGNMCDANKFSTTKTRKLCFDAILFYLRDDADEQLCTLQELIYKEKKKEFECF